MQVTGFFEKDSCLDVGGRIKSATGACLLDQGSPYASLLSRPDLYTHWTFFIILAFAPGWISSWILRKAFSRIRESVQSCQTAEDTSTNDALQK